MRIKKFRDYYLIENNIKIYKNHNLDNIYDGSVVSDYYKSLDSRENFDEYLYKYLLSNDYTLERIKIKDIIENDIDLENFTQEEINDKDGYYTQNERSLFNPVIIGEIPPFKNMVVIDGYHRITELLRNGETYINAYVPIINL